MANRYWLTTCANFSVNISDLSGGEVPGAVNDLTWNPHPTDFYPYAEVLTAGDGQQIGLGYTNFKWATPGDATITSEQGNYLMSFFTGDESDALI